MFPYRDRIAIAFSGPDLQPINLYIMKTKILLAMGLMASVYGYGQTYFNPSGSAGTVGTSSIYLGKDAGINSVTGASGNIFIGFESGKGNSTGTKNVFIGTSTGILNTTGDQNVFIGYYAGHSANSDAENNVFIGFNAGQVNLGEQNVNVGSASGTNNTHGVYNSFFGHGSGRDSTGDNNAFIGAGSGSDSSGSENVAVGRNAGKATGSGGVFLGYNAGLTETGDDKLYIANSDTPDPLIYGDFDAGLLRLNGLVGIGSPFGLTDFPSLAGDFANYKLFVKGNILAEEVRIRTFSTWPDYVFSNDYTLLSLKETEKFIAENGHLPNMPSAAEVKEQGLEMGNITKLQQEKIEELTLHAIAQEKRIEALERQLQLLLDKQ